MTVTPPDRRTIITDALQKIDELSARLEIAEKGDTEPIAVVGMGCRFPGGVNNPNEYWQLLQKGVDGIVRVPPERWDADAYYCVDHTVPGTICTREGGFLTSWQPDEFDAEFFGISPREAAGMDPQQRLLLEVAWEALENAGITPHAIRGTQTSVFVGLTTNDYSLTFAGKLRPEDLDPYIPFGNASNFAAGRLAYFLGVHGPAVVIDTACSSSLVAVHLACQSLRRRESDNALAAGVNLMLSPENSIACSRWGMLAPDGRCKTFDAGADGYVRSEGCGVAVLKRLSDALRDGDPVLAVVRGSAVNQDGPSSGQTVPNGPAQQALLRQTLAASRLQPADIDYIEAHGTGTSLGDPIELEALSQVFSERNGSAPLVLGSVKTNLGHLESAAGIAGFIKTVLSVRNGHIPKHLHFERLTPHASDHAARFTIASQPMSWPTVARARRAGVSSFGVSGTNAHVVIEQAPDPDPVVREPEPAVSTLVISGRTPARISATAGMLADWMQGDGAGVALADLAYTFEHHRARHKNVAAVCARDRAQAVAGLQLLAAGETTIGVVGPHQRPSGSGAVFVYSGQGSQWAGMGRQLLADEPAFGAAVDGLEPVFVEQVGFSLRQVLADGEPVSGDARVQPVIMGLQLALTDLWDAYGVHPAAVIGHSMGEVTAAVVSGALTRAEGLRVIAARSQLMSRLAGKGAVALLGLDAEATAAAIADFPEVSVTVYAAPRQTVIAGPVAQVDAVIAAVKRKDGLARRVNMEVASHTALMDPILPELLTALADLTPKNPVIPFLSTVCDGTTAPLLDARYWVANVRVPVQFSRAIAAAGHDHATFIEFSAHPLVTHAITDILESAAPSRRHLVTSAMRRGKDETLFFHSQLAAVGAPARAARGRFVDLPPTPWLHSRYWITNRSTGPEMTDAHPLLGVHVEMPCGTGHLWQADVGTEKIPWLADHRVHGRAVMPAAAFAEMALAAGSEALGLPVEAVSVERLEVEQNLSLNSHTRVTTQLVRSADNAIGVEIYSCSPDGNWCRHATARVQPVQAAEDTVERRSPAAESQNVVSPADFYAALRRTGADHGPAFFALTRIVRMPDGGSETDIVAPDQAVAHRNYRIHPVMLDAALQSLAAAMPALGNSDDVTYLPVSVEAIRVFGDVGRRARCRAELVDVDDDGAGKLGRVTLMDEAGTPTAEVVGIRLGPTERPTVPLPLEQKVFDTVWVECPVLSEPAASDLPTGSWLVLSGDTDAEALTKRFIARFGSPAQRMLSADLSDESAVRRAITETAADPKLPPVGVIVFVGDRAFDGADSGGALLRAQDLIWSVSATARAVVDAWPQKSPRLWLVARNGLAVHGDEPGDPAIGALKGLIRTWGWPGEFARVLADEPDLRATLVDLDAANDSLSTLVTELASSSSDDTVAWRGKRRFVERLSRATLSERTPDPLVRPDGAYIVTGGLGGLGMVVVHWLVDSGAGRVVLNGRSGPSDTARTALADLESRAEVTVVRGDIASSGVAEQLVSAAEETGLPLRGVVHAAGVLDDGLVAALNRESLERVWTAKAAGALRLHEATADRQLDWWVGFSSMAALLGLPGQAAYACANAWLDALVAWRTAWGLPGIAINWGQWADVGIGRSVTLSVLDPITPAEGVEALESLVGRSLTRVGVARLRLDRAAAASPEIREIGYFAGLVEELDTLCTDDRPTLDD
ncbi:type I polyketide synthase, partial [Mycobacterium sp.]|uniref:type I polyketide synthase n=1 Tax=Mycobacterium sp. TaxID=1785 RepID=UPI002D879455|nr:type I polyketide synthase [Mycobacterium sp.]